VICIESIEKLKFRLDMQQYEEEFLILLDGFNSGVTYEEQNDWFVQLNNHRLLYESTKNSLMIQHFGNSDDEKIHEDYTYFIEEEPRYLALVGDYYRAILRARFREQLESKWGEQLFRLAEIKQKTFNNQIVNEIQNENRLIAQYQQLVGKAVICFQDQKLSFASLAPYLSSSDRAIRKEAHESKAQYFKDHEDDFDILLDKLVKTRHQIALKLGYPSFVELGYDRMNRTSYTPDDLIKYRKQVKEHGVLFISTLRKKQQNRIGVSKLKYYDEPFSYPKGAPKPNGTTQDILNTYRSIFNEMSPETAAFFEEVLAKGNIDVESRLNKMNGAFASYVGSEVSPFIYANFNGTSNDVRVFAHEAGHAFQFYMTRHLNIHEYIIPYDSAELFSFSMERLVWPWMDQFFGSETDKYKFSHLTGAFMFMPLASAVDEFEHFLFIFPNATIQERKQKWKELEHQYIPERDYDGNEFLEQGTGFYEIGHLFTSPFYFMDYDLAHFCSVQLWIKDQEHGESFASYLKMCERGGSLSFNELLKSADLVSPFEENSLKPLIQKVQKWINQVDDQLF
jgi:M3 family oligoendopeptidase